MAPFGSGNSPPPNSQETPKDKTRSQPHHDNLPPAVSDIALPKENAATGLPGHEKGRPTSAAPVA